MLHICNSPAFLNYNDMHLNSARIGSAFLGRVNSNTDVGLKKIGQLQTNITEIKTLPKNYNIGYINSYKTKKEVKVAIAQIGYIEGYNVSNKTDTFRPIDKVRRLYQTFKKLFKKEKLSVYIKGKKYNIVGSLGMYHIEIDITNSDIQVNDLVTLEVNPIYIDRKIRREYI